MELEKKMKPDERPQKTSTDQRSEEVTDIIERMPVGWTRLVVAIIMLVVLVTVSLGCIIKYPDTVMGQISITGEKSPVRPRRYRGIPARHQGIQHRQLAGGQRGVLRQYHQG